MLCDCCYAILKDGRRNIFVTDSIGRSMKATIATIMIIPPLDLLPPPTTLDPATWAPHFAFASLLMITLEINLVKIRAAAAALVQFDLIAIFLQPIPDENSLYSLILLIFWVRNGSPQFLTYFSLAINIPKVVVRW